MSESMPLAKQLSERDPGVVAAGQGIGLIFCEPGAKERPPECTSRASSCPKRTKDNPEDAAHKDWHENGDDNSRPQLRPRITHRSQSSASLTFTLNPPLPPKISRRLIM